MPPTIVPTTAAQQTPTLARSKVSWDSYVVFTAELAAAGGLASCRPTTTR